MSNQQKDNQSSGSAGSEGLRKQDRDDTGGPRGDALGNAVGAAAGGTGPGPGEAASASDTRTGTNKGGASKA